MPRYKQSWFRSPLVLSLAALAAAILLHAAGWLTPLETAVVVALRPLQRGTTAIGSALADRWPQIRGRGELRGENRRLQEMVQQMAVENQELKQQLSALGLVQEQTEFLQRRELPAINVHVIARELSQDTNAVVIDRGRAAGVRPGAAVVVGDGMLVGRVIEVGEAHAKVMLLTDGRSATAVRLDRSPAVTGVVKGEFGASLKLDLIPVSAEVAPGDLVVTSGAEAGLPAGLIVGAINRAEIATSGFFYNAYIQPLVPYHGLTVAAVLTGRE